jgi:4-hydroxy-3-methylbut-2-en-1-yl diphosphate reductase
VKIILANPRGFCAGVDRAIDIVEAALRSVQPPVYVRHEVVHNRFVVDELRAKGAIFVDQIDEIPEGATVVFSAHGVSQAVREQAQQKGLRVFDATCPLVTKVHYQVIRQAKANQECILIGHKGHPEVEGTLGQYENTASAIYLVENVADVATLQVSDPDNLMYVTQTTLSVDDTQHVIAALQQRFPTIQGPRKDDICYATQNRQNAVKQLAELCDVVVVVGSKNSSNSNRLSELAERLGCSAYLIDNASLLQRDWFTDTDTVGVTAGASAPEVLVQQVVQQLQAWGATECHSMQGQEETIKFALPKGLRGEEAAR